MASKFVGYLKKPVVIVAGIGIGLIILLRGKSSGGGGGADGGYYNAIITTHHDDAATAQMGVQADAAKTIAMYQAQADIAKTGAAVQGAIAVTDIQAKRDLQISDKQFAYLDNANARDYFLHVHDNNVMQNMAYFDFLGRNNEVATGATVTLDLARQQHAAELGLAPINADVAKTINANNNNANVMISANQTAAQTAIAKSQAKASVQSAGLGALTGIISSVFGGH